MNNRLSHFNVGRKTERTSKSVAVYIKQQVTTTLKLNQWHITTLNLIGENNPLSKSSSTWLVRYTYAHPCYVTQPRLGSYIQPSPKRFAVNLHRSHRHVHRKSCPGFGETSPWGPVALGLGLEAYIRRCGWSQSGAGERARYYPSRRDVEGGEDHHVQAGSSN